MKLPHPLDIRQNFAAKLSFDLVIFLNNFPKAVDFRRSQLFCLFCRRYGCKFQNFPGRRKAKPVDIRERILDSLFIRNIYTDDSHDGIVISSRPMPGLVRSFWLRQNLLYRSAELHSAPLVGIVTVLTTLTRPKADQTSEAIQHFNPVVVYASDSYK